MVAEDIKQGIVARTEGRVGAAARAAEGSGLSAPAR